MLHLVFLGLLTAAYATKSLGPPKLLIQPPDDVWFQLNESPHAPPVLKCVASDNTDSYSWNFNGEPLEVDGTNLKWERPGQTGSLVLAQPSLENQGYYQCMATNVFGTAVTTKVHLQVGVLKHFVPRPIRRIQVKEGSSLSIDCHPPHGTPTPIVFWLYRDTEQKSVIETIRRRHIAVDMNGKLHFAKVLADDGRANLIYECAATSPVLHGEYRSGDQIQLDVIPQQFHPVEPHILFTSPSELTVRAGGRLKLQCIFGGNPLPNVLWSKLDGNLPKARIRPLSTAESDFGVSLIVENVVPEDAGRYECRSSNLVHVMNVKVLAAPYWQLDAPTDVTSSEGASAELHCLAGGQPPPIVRWSFNGRPLHELSDEGRRVVLDGGRLLRLVDLRHDIDTGVYQCNASNPLGYVFANAFIHVRAHAPQLLMPAQRVWKVVLHSTLRMNCDVDAAPEAVVRWVDQDDRPLQVVEGKTTLSTNYTYSIFDVSTADEGLYYCNVSNKYGIARATNEVLVYKPTYFVKVPSPRTLQLESGKTAEFHCEAVSDEKITVEYKWTLNGEIIKNSSHFQILPDRLRVVNARGKLSGIIGCAAVTDVDVKQSSMDLTIRDVPSNPDAEMTKCSEKKATIRWKASNPHGDPVIRYVVEVHTDFKKNIWEIVTEETDVSKEEFEVDATLTPWVNYTFRVIAINSHGRSDIRHMDSDDEVAVELKCGTRPSVPYTNPNGVWAEGNQPDNLVIHWNPMEKYYWNAPGLQYLIRYKLNEPHHSWTEFLIEDPLVNETTIRDLPTFREYLVEVRAVNSKGPSILEPEVIKGFSGEDVPSETPANFELLSIHNHSAAEFSWSPVNPASLRGHFEGYEIEFWSKSGPVRKQKLLLKKNTTQKVITTFNANTKYGIRVAARNKQYVSQYSREIEFETPEGTPSKVHNLRVISVGARSILVQWQPPRQPNGILRGYFLSFENERNETEETYVVHKQLHYLHEKSEPDTSYKVSVWAETKAGEGPRTIRPTHTWPARDPDPPYFVVSNVTQSSFVVTWKPANGTVWRMPGSSFFVNYSLSGSEDYQRSTEIYLPETQIVIMGLQDATKYDLVAVARDGISQSSSDILPVTTSPKENVAHLNQESLRAATWFVVILAVVALVLLLILCTCCLDERRSRRYAVHRKELEIGHQAGAAEEERRFLEYQYGLKK